MGRLSFLETSSFSLLFEDWTSNLLWIIKRNSEFPGRWGKCLEIDKCVDSVGVHVRRGDLKEEVSSYGAPASFDYFINATAFFKKKLYRPYFYFFSDEPEWVKMDLLPRLSVKDCAEVVDINGSDKGYMDLYLLAHCKHQITTKGTLGKFGALLADNPDKYVVLYNDETQQYWKMLLQNPVFI